MSGIRTGSRLEELLRLERQIKHEIEVERARDLDAEAGRITPPPPPGHPLIRLLAAAQAHPSKRVHAKAQRVLDAAAVLQQTLRDEDRRATERAAREAQPRATPRVTDKVVAFRERDAQLRAQAPAADVRAWAHTHGIPCPDKGRISTELRQQYLNHTRQQEDQPA